MDPDNTFGPIQLNQNYLEYDIFALFRISVTNLIQLKASLAKNFHIQPSEIDAMPMWEYEMFINELNEQVKQENKQQQAEMDKYHVKDYMNAASPKNIQRMTNPKLPNFSSGIKIK